LICYNVFDNHRQDLTFSPHADFTPFKESSILGQAEKMETRQLLLQQQTKLRQLLHTRGQWSNAQSLFLCQHAMLHSAALEVGSEWSYEDAILDGLTEDQMRLQPDEGMNSIVWLIWHMGRIEDVTMNFLVASRPQVLDEENWLEQLHLVRRDVGTSMNDAEVADISAKVHIPALRTYRVAVGRRTREIVRNLQPTEAEERVDTTHIQALISAGALAEGAYDLAEYWSGKRKTALLAMPATRHSLTHLNQALLVRNKLGLGF
jgi:hypothetical protein